MELLLVDIQYKVQIQWFEFYVNCEFCFPPYHGLIFRPRAHLMSKQIGNSENNKND